VDAVLDISRAFVNTIEIISIVKDEERTDIQKAELIQAYGGLKVALQLLRPIISSKPLLDSAQTSLIVTRDKKDTDPDYFEAHNFLVKLRLAALSVLKGLWQAPWLISAPLSVSKSVVQAVLELANGEGEDSKGGDTSTVEVHATPSGGIGRPPGPDEGRVQILMDMGFPRSAAERALSRTHNNLNAATELLLAHPFPLPPDPEPEQPAVTEPAATEESTTDTEPTAVPVDGEASSAVENDVTEAAGPSEPTNIPIPDTSEAPVTGGKSSEQWKKELDEAREPLRAGLSRQALLLIDEHVSLLFDLHVVFLRPNNAHRAQAVQDLVDDVKAFSPSAYDVQEQPLANRCRLLALVLSESPSLLSHEVRATLMDSLLALLLSSINLEHPPRWLATHLLVTEALFTLSAEPRVITLPKEGEPIIPEAISVGPPLLEAKEIVFDFCLRLLAVQDLPGDELLSTLRLFVFLTRDPKTAAQFVRSGGVSLLLKRVKASAVASSSSYIATILRHIVEDAQTIRHIMQHTLDRNLSQPRARGLIDVTNYVRSCSAAALRDPEIFLEVTKSLCQLGQPYSSPYISLKHEASPATNKPDLAPQVEGAVEMQVDQTTAIAITPSESTDNIIHHMIGELMNSTKAMNELLSQPSATVGDGHSISDAHVGQSKDVAMKSGADDSLASLGAESAGLRDYMCFLMQCLTELLFSYDSCKLAFLSYSPKKRTQTPAKDTGGRYRTATLQFLLMDFITFGTINPPADERTRNRTTLCNLAMSVLVALCIDSTPNHDVKDVSPELASVRKFVLESVSRAIKDLPPFETVEVRYGRLLALADLCHRLLTVKVTATSRKQHDENPTHIAKVMLEKGFVATLTTALSEIDLNYPHIRNLVPSILRPLEFL
jgi:E3 ubiquitin-protein ligase HUWE1